MKTKITFLYVAINFCININITVFAQAVNVQDSLALVDLYDSTDGSNWTNHNNWLTGPVRNWAGIQVTGNRVTSISLHENNLHGNIPSSFGNLINLQFLWLGQNQLIGNIPSSFGNLINLQTLWSSQNQLSGNIPSSFGNLI